MGHLGATVPRPNFPHTPSSMARHVTSPRVGSPEIPAAHWPFDIDVATVLARAQRAPYMRNEHRAQGTGTAWRGPKTFGTRSIRACPT